MNSLYDLMDKLKKIDEAEATAPPRGANMDPAYLQKALNPGGVRMLITPQDAQVALDWLKANPNYKPGQEAPATTGLDPQKAAVQQMAAKSVIKSYLRDKQHLDMVNGYYIEAETGILKHSMIANRTMSAGNQGTTLATSNFMGFGDGKAFADALAEAGLKIEPTTITTKGLFKDNTTPALKVDVALLNKIASGQNGQAPAPVNPAPVNPAPVNPAPVNPAPVTTGSDQKADQTATNGPDPKDVAELRDILTKLGITIPDKYSVSSAPNAIVPRKGGLSNFYSKEGIEFKSSIGKTLFEAEAVQADVRKVDNAIDASTALSDDERIKLKARATTLFDKLLPFKDDLEVGPLLAAYQSQQGPMTGTTGSDQKVDPKPPVRPGPYQPPVKKKDNWPDDWKKVKIVKANQHSGYGPNGQPLYILGDKTPSRTAAYYRQENKTLVPMNFNGAREDLTQYKPVPWDEAVKWGTASAAPAATDPALAHVGGSDQKVDTAATGNVPPQPTLNGKPSTGPKGREWLKKYGATHNPDGTPKAKTGNDQKVAPTGNVKFSKDVPAEAQAKLPQTAKPGEYFWVNGERYEYASHGGRGYSSQQWEPNTPWTGWAGRQELKRQNYTGPDDKVKHMYESVNDDLTRLVSLVHHR